MTPLAEPNPCGASYSGAETPVAEARSHRVIWLGEQECFSWGVTAWASVAGCDLSHDYSRLARWRTTDPGERAKAMRVDKPPVEVDGQADLFGEVAS